MANEEFYAAIAAGDDEAWQELNKQVYVWLYNYCRARLSWMTTPAREDFVAECTQEALLHIWTRVDRYASRGSFLGWCRTVALNITKDQIRRSAGEAAGTAETEIEDGESVSTVELTAEQKELLDRIMHDVNLAVQTVLSERERTVFEGLTRHNQTTKALAVTLDTTVNNIYQIWRRARRKVRRDLESRGYTSAELRRYQLL